MPLEDVAHRLIADIIAQLGQGTGDWDVPIGGMGAVSGALAAAAAPANLDPSALLDVKVKLWAEIGRARMPSGS